MRKVKFVIISTIIFLFFVNTILTNAAKGVSVKTELFELYAPNESELKKAKEELEFAAKKFQKYFGEKPPKIAVYVVNSPSEVSKIDFGSFSRRGLRVLPFISNEYLKNLKKKKEKKVGLAEARALSHEAGHKYFITYVNNKITSSNNSGLSFKYGHSAIADWFDEAIATLCEYPMLQTQRYEFLKKHIDKTIPFEEFFKMEHPFFAKNKNKLGGTTKTITAEEAKKLLKNLPKGAQIRVISGDNIATTKDVMFYTQALALTDFLIDKNGDKVIGKIAKGLIEGKKINNVFAELDPKYVDLEKLEKDWKNWAKNKIK